MASEEAVNVSSSTANYNMSFKVERKLISFGGHPYFVVVTGDLVNNRLKTLQFVPLRAVGPQNRHNFGD